MPLGNSRMACSEVFPDLVMADTDLLNVDICNRARVCFLHIPKCAGTSVKQSLGIYLRDHSLLRDMYAQGMSKDVKVVSVVRNPYDRLVSAYEHIKKGLKHNRTFKSLVLEHYSSFDDFVLNWLDEKTIYKWIHFVPQWCFLVDRTGDIPVSIYKLERIDLDWPELQSLFKGNGKGQLTKQNKSDRRAFESYYQNDRVRQKVYDLYRKDFELLGYSGDIVGDLYGPAM